MCQWKFLGFQIKREYVGQNGIHGSGDVLGRSGLRSVGVASGALCLRTRSSLLVFMTFLS